MALLQLTSIRMSEQYYRNELPASEYTFSPYLIIQEK